MGWKDWHYWLKSGSIFGLVYIFMSVITYTGVVIRNFDSLHFLLGILLAFPAAIFLTFAGFCPELACIDLGIPSSFLSGLYRFFKIGLHWVIIINSLFYFLIGALIGWIVGKVKSKK